MKIYKTQQEIEADIVDRVLTINDNVKFECSFAIEASIKVIGNINALNIKALDIDAADIKADDINALNIKANNIDALDIKAEDISARNIKAWDINARDISFFAVAFAYISFRCKSISGRRENSKYFCLDSEVEINKLLK